MTVHSIVELLASGMTLEEVLAYYADLERAGGVPGLVSVSCDPCAVTGRPARECRMRRSRDGRLRSRPPVTCISTSRPDGSAPSTHLAPWCSDSLFSATGRSASQNACKSSKAGSRSSPSAAGEPADHHGVGARRTRRLDARSASPNTTQSIPWPIKMTAGARRAHRRGCRCGTSNRTGVTPHPSSDRAVTCGGPTRGSACGTGRTLPTSPEPVANRVAAEPPQTAARGLSHALGRIIKPYLGD